MNHGSPDELGPVIAALADPTRRSIVARLAEGDAPSATALTSDLPMSRQAVAKHLRVLEDAELIVTRRHGREARVTLRPEHLSEVSRWLDELGARWERRLDDLRTRAEAADDEEAPLAAEASTLDVAPTAAADDQRGT